MLKKLSNTYRPTGDIVYSKYTPGEKIHKLNVFKGSRLKQDMDMGNVSKWGNFISEINKNNLTEKIIVNIENLKE